MSLTAVLAGSLLQGMPAVAAPSPRLQPKAEKLDNVGGPVAGKGWTQKRVKDAPTALPVWPKAGSTRLDLHTAGGGIGVRAGAAPVFVQRATSPAGARLAEVTVEVIDQTTLPKGWRDRVALRVSAPTGQPTGTAKVSIDYNSFKAAAGGDWATRLRLWQSPACALTTPDKPACKSVPLRTDNDLGTGVVSADVPVDAAQALSAPQTKAQLAGDAPVASAQGAIVMLAAAASGSDGDFGATSLAASSTWSAGGSSGNFSWNYPLRMPPATGPTPTIALSYSSASVDGRSEVTNNQPSWIGEGFEYAPGYIERRYVPCLEDMKNGANNTVASGDECWRSDNATMSLNGAGGELIYETGKGWHSRSEGGSKIEKLTGAGNGDNDGEYWKVTTTDGTQYFFGLHSLPGQTAKTNSTLTVPVFGNHTGEPCHQSTFAGSDCVQAWRWNLDYVVDVRGNTMSYWYGKETNKYARNNTDSDDVTYDRAGYLTRIDYGTYDRNTTDHGVTERSVTPYAQVLFDTDMRCFSNCGTETAPVTASWKDTPWDQECKASATSCPQQYAPTFWTAKRLKTITTQVWDTTKTTPAWQPVESWTLNQTFNATADSTHTGLWLDKIDHQGLVRPASVPPAEFVPISMPPVTFEAISLPNRVLEEHGTSDNWLRINSIITETGARIKVDYSEPECTSSNLPAAAHTNTMRCYPVLVEDPMDSTKLVEQWWHKHVVTHVVEDDVQLADSHQSPSKHTWYEYVGTPAWHYADDDGLSKPDHKTWSQWRGYGQVKTRIGNTTGAQTLTVTTFMRGMNGDRATPTGGTRTVQVNASLGAETVYDEDQFADQVREQAVFNGDESKPVSKTVNVPWRSNPTASRTINGDVAEARFTNTSTAYTAAALGIDGNRGWRVSRGMRTFDQTYGTTNWSQDDGDIAVTGDEKCTTNTYNRRVDKNIVTMLREVFVTALACGQAPQSTDDVISDVRNTYDGAASYTTAPVYGTVTKAERLKDWTLAGGTVWQTVSQATVDSIGRPLTQTDVKGNVTTVTYTPAVGGPVTSVSSKITAAGATPYNWVTSTDTNPFWGSTTKTVDANSKVTAEVEYDALGRTTNVWKLGWDRAGHLTTPGARYSYTFAPNRDSYPSVKTETLNPDGNYITSYQILDGMLRPRQTQSIAMNGSGDRVVSDTIYDEYGNAAISYPAHAEPGAPAGTFWWEPEWSVPTINKTEYDLASRPTATVFLAGDDISVVSEKWRTVTTHEGDLTMTTPPAGGIATTTVTDIKGRTVALRQHTTASGVAGAYQETKYEFNKKGEPVKTTDPAGNQWTAKFDVKGRQIESVDPDKGKTLSEYDDYDQLIKATDARNEVLYYVYDGLGRKTQLRDDSATGPLRAEWKYDSLYSGQTGFRGQLTQSIRYEPAGVTANAYKWQVRGFTTRYQPTGVNYVIPTVETGLNNTYIYGYTYAGENGAPLSISYPAGGSLVTEQLTTDYDATTGMATSMDTSLTGSVGTMATASYTAYGQLSKTIYMTPGGGLYVDNLFDYYTDTHRLKTDSVKPQNAAGTVSNRAYTYDNTGNVTSITDAPGVGSADTQCFRYDNLARLTTAWTPTSTVPCSTDPTVANLGGPAPYWQDWTFDSTTSLKTETSHTTGGNTTRSYTVPTGGQNVVRPHAVTQMAVGGVTTNYTYDNTGNTVCRPTGTAANNCGTGTNSQTLNWDAEGKLATVSSGGSTVETNIYDANGVRLIRRDSTGTTLYLPSQEIRREGTVNTGTRYYSFAGRVCASRRADTSGNTDLTWVYGDQQGTQQVSVNAGTQATSVRRQTPYGAPRGTNPAWINNKGFVGGDNDPTGLTNIGARQYDLALSRFISVDPKLVVSDPSQYNAYQYASLNPITMSDPSGTVVTATSEGAGGGDGPKCDAACQDRRAQIHLKEVMARQAARAYDARLQALKAAILAVYSNGELSRNRYLAEMKSADAEYLEAANAERDAMISYLTGEVKAGRISMTSLKSVTTVTAAWNPKTGSVYVGWRLSGYHPAGFCAEDDCAQQAAAVGEDVADLQFTVTLRPRDSNPINVCVSCQKDYPESQFAVSGAKGDAGGAWGVVETEAEEAAEAEIALQAEMQAVAIAEEQAVLRAEEMAAEMVAEE
ncbi:hypothetical protein Cs7R123_56890 [Catellatospora sp. TT07R-123]|uniref:RHS repeat-associated core domain-containing protein n=1 Tax=Catellatospora sp. TT07R-123 TaxID=2733863 RepID=UPI001B0AAD5D|nr:RHS repeat-associated core domain-containing protein [Catellatospora sp. TT07R-123]GHJ48347.1 hypothetical protein Cs7R123_56890 [Catellatospora sp. TT07R-123]